MISIKMHQPLIVQKCGPCFYPAPFSCFSTKLAFTTHGCAQTPLGLC